LAAFLFRGNLGALKYVKSGRGSERRSAKPTFKGVLERICCGDGRATGAATNQRACAANIAQSEAAPEPRHPGTDLQEGASTERGTRAGPPRIARMRRAQQALGVHSPWSKASCHDPRGLDLMGTHRTDVFFSSLQVVMWGFQKNGGA